MLFQEALDAVSLKFSTDLERELGRLIEAAKLSIAVSEFVSGGDVLSKLTELSHGSHLILGGVVGSSPAMQVHFGGVSATHIRQYGIQSREGVLALAESISDRTQANISIATSGNVQFFPDIGPHFCRADVWAGYIFLGQHRLDHVVLEGKDQDVRLKILQLVLMKLKGWLSHYVAEADKIKEK